MVPVVKGQQACLMTLANAKLIYKLHVTEAVFCSAIFLLCYVECNCASLHAFGITVALSDM